MTATPRRSITRLAAVALAVASLLTLASGTVPAGGIPASTEASADTGRAYASAVNNRGEIVGWASIEAGGFHAVLWPAAEVGHVSDLGTLGGPESRAWGINDLGEVIGESQTASGAWHAFRYTEADGMRDLGTLPGATSCTAVDINDRSEVVGTCQVPQGGGSVPNAVVWSGGRVTPLHSYSASEHTEAHGINDRGEIAGFGGDYNRLVVWAPDRRIDLPTLPRVGSVGHVPEINDSGQVIVNDYVGGSYVGQVWTPGRNGNYESEPAVIEVGTFGDVQDLNEAADVVGQRATPTGQRAFVWSRGTLTDLAELPGSIYCYANGINDRREVVGACVNASGARSVAWSDGQVIHLSGMVSPPR